MGLCPVELIERQPVISESRLENCYTPNLVIRLFFSDCALSVLNNLLLARRFALEMD